MKHRVTRLSGILAAAILVVATNGCKPPRPTALAVADISSLPALPACDGSYQRNDIWNVYDSEGTDHFAQANTFVICEIGGGYFLHPVKMTEHWHENVNNYIELKTVHPTGIANTTYLCAEEVALQNHFFGRRPHNVRFVFLEMASRLHLSECHNGSRCSCEAGSDLAAPRLIFHGGRAHAQH